MNTSKAEKSIFHINIFKVEFDQWRPQDSDNLMQQNPQESYEQRGQREQTIAGRISCNQHISLSTHPQLGTKTQDQRHQTSGKRSPCSPTQYS